MEPGTISCSPFAEGEEAGEVVERTWFCTCTGKPRELVVVDTGEDEAGEPACPRCGASPSSDPKHTIGYRDEERPKRV